MALLSYALTTLAGLKSQLGITGTDQDDWLTDLINATTERIERETGLRFAATDYVYWHSGRGERDIVLPQYPIIRLNAAACGVRNGISVAYSGSAIFAQVAVSTTGIRLSTTATDGTVTATDIAWSSYPTLSTVVAAIDAVSGWTASLSGNDGLAKHARPGTTDTKRQTATLEVADDYTHATLFDAEAGLVALGDGAYAFDVYGGGGYASGPAVAYGRQNIMVDYRAGYETIPADLDQIAREFAAGMYYGASTNSNLQSESLGSYSYSLADKTTITDGMRAVLARYTREAIA